MALALPASGTSASKSTAPTPDGVDVIQWDDGTIALAKISGALYASFAAFMTELVDERGDHLQVAEHHEDWCRLFQKEPLLVLLAPRDHGKRLAVDTPIATPTGWTTMGDLRAGDALFDDRGQTCHVAIAHPVEMGDSYRVTFDDGSSLVADAEHLWLTWDAKARKSANRHGWPQDHGAHAPTPPAVRTTAEIRDSLMVGREHNHSIPIAHPLHLPDSALPVNPYALGAWLGDGTTAQAAMTIHEAEMAALIEQAGCRLRPRKDPHAFGMIDHTSRLRQLGVLGNKHIPAVYLRASEGQRRALMAGLMDTDGHVAPDGTVEYTSTVEALAEGVRELAVSLGWKPRVYAGRAMMYGQDCGPKWRVCWSPREPVFRLTRKANRLRTFPERGWRTRHRFIVSVEPIGSVPMRCITVDAPSRLYLAGRQMVPTHNTWTSVSYLLWRIWRHNRNPWTGLFDPALPDGKFEAVLFSDTLPQAEHFFDLLQNLLLANTRLFGDILPSSKVIAGRRDVWSKRRIRLRNLASVIIRAYRTSTRGLHPDLIVLDDVLNDRTTMTAYQRDKIWRYFVGTLLPMNASQYVVIGTAFHYDDLLHRLKPDPKKAPLRIGKASARFKWVKFRAIDWDTGETLWDERHDVEDLQGKRDMDPLIFAREYQNDPVDDSSSMFPYALTSRALERGSQMTFAPSYQPRPGEYVVGGMDLAESAEVGADYTVLAVAAYERPSGHRRLLWAVRERGLGFDAQVNVLRRACMDFGVDVCVVEENGFQKWLFSRVRSLPETAGRVIGHRTGMEKASLQEGVPAMRIVLENDLWTLPTGDEASRQFAHVWQSEINAFGWKDSKLQGVGEHDDTVMAFWFLERAIRFVDQSLWRAGQEGQEIYTGEDLGITPVKIGPDF